MMNLKHFNNSPTGNKMRPFASENASLHQETSLAEAAPSSGKGGASPRSKGEAVHSTASFLVGSASLHAPEWKAFRFEHGSYLLHVPSSTVVESPDEVLSHVLGSAVDPQIQVSLDELAAQLPVPERPRLEVDIQAISLNMAQDCNLRCTYCFAGENANYGHKGRMSLATAIAAIDYFAHGKDRFSVTFFGGEPLLAFDVIQKVVAWCETQPTRFYFSITTNGTLLTEDKVSWLRDKKFKVVLSYDGKGLQDKQRPLADHKTSSRPWIDRKLDTFSARLNELRELELRTTIEKGNLELLEAAIMDTLTSRNYKLLISKHTTPLRKLAFAEADVEALAQIYRRVIDRLLAAENYEALMRLGPISSHLSAISGQKTAQLSCAAGVNYITVSIEGNFYLCHRFNEDASEQLGGLECGFDKARAEKFARFRYERPDPCGSCWMREWCSGGCFHENKTHTNDTLRVNPIFCKLQDLETREAMRVYTLLRDRAPHLFED